MSKQYRWLTVELGTAFFYVVAFVALIFSPFLLSISMIGLMVMAIWAAWERQHQINPPERTSFWKRPEFWGLLFLFIQVVIPGLWSENQSYWLGRVRIRLPFLLMPIAFFYLPTLSYQIQRKLGWLYLMVVSITAVAVTINFMMNYDAIIDAVGRGQAIPVPRRHIRFSLNIAVAAFISLYMLFSERNTNRDRIILGLIAIWLLFFLHMIAVRSGIFAFYMAVLVSGLMTLAQKKYRKYGIAVLIGLAFLPIIGSQIPSLKRKMDYVRYDLNKFMEGDGISYSDSERISSIRIGVEIGNRSPLIGVGVGDVLDIINREYYTKFIGEPKIPHNEWVNVYAGSGYLGVLMMAVALGAPLIAILRKRIFSTQVLYVAIWTIILTSIMTEPTFEVAMGVGLSVLWLMFVAKEPT